MAVIYILIIILMRVAQSIFNKRSSRLVPLNPVGYLKYTLYYQGIATILGFFLVIIEIMRSSSFNGLSETILLASISGIALSVCCMCGVYSLYSGTMVLNSMFGTAGLLIPTIASIFMFNEPMTIFQWLALGLFMVSAFLLIGSSKKINNKFSFKTLLILIISLITNGATMLIQKIFGMQVIGGNTSLFSFVTFASGTLIIALAILILKIIAKIKDKSKVIICDKSEKIDIEIALAKDDASLNKKFGFNEKLPKGLYLFGGILAVAVFVINQLATLCAPLMPSVVLFTIINGGATIISAIVGATMYKEKINLKSGIGLVLGIGALILIKIL